MLMKSPQSHAVHKCISFNCLVKVIQNYSLKLFTVINGKLIDDNGNNYAASEVKRIDATPVLDNDRLVMYIAYFLTTNDFNFGYLLANIDWLEDDVTEFITEVHKNT